MKLAHKQELQVGLSLKMWLPILQSSITELETHLNGYKNDNPFVEIKSPVETKDYYKTVDRTPYYMQNSDTYYRSGEFVEEMAIGVESFYERLFDQIEAPLFPTPKSQKIAHDIIENLSEYGYFEGNIEAIAIKNNVTNEFVESIRQRFAYLEPSGVGAVDYKESFLFQLSEIDLDNELLKFTKKLIENIEKIDKYSTHHLFSKAKDIIKTFKNPPALEYIDNEERIIPDFFVEIGDDIKIRINSSFYPDIIVKEPFACQNEEIKEKIKEAKNLVNLLNLRKSTLYKLVLSIVEKQLSFFVGGELKPLKMAEIATELGFAESTISRAVSNKYIECNRGVYALKDFFTNAVNDEDTSSSEIKSFMKKLIEFEDHDNPLTDDDMLVQIKQRFDIEMVRRSITKYRKLENIPSSKERKKFYKVQ
ncbi:MAG: RNA polymerase factor sigma-54 [Arcobacteraceae bacterium]|nr:RNA polymerase factor sigma-54 [Arcobacteraceae bacterium]